MDERVNVKALFLGPKAENYGYFKEMLGYLMDDHSEWRRNFHPEWSSMRYPSISLKKP